jgi:hypothetical protein
LRQFRRLSLKNKPVHSAHHAQRKRRTPAIMYMRLQQFANRTALYVISRSPAQQMGIQWRAQPFAPVRLQPA